MTLVFKVKDHTLYVVFALSACGESRVEKADIQVF